MKSSCEEDWLSCFEETNGIIRSPSCKKTIPYKAAKSNKIIITTDENVTFVPCSENIALLRLGKL